MVKAAFHSMKEKFQAFGEKMMVWQTKLFTNLFYFLVVPFAYLYLLITRRIHHQNTGYFTDAEHASNKLEDHLRQY